MVKLVICDGFLPYRKNTAQSFDTTTYLWLQQHFHLEH